MPVLDPSATEALRLESHALVMRARAAVARCQRARDEIVRSRESRSRLAGGSLRELSEGAQGTNGHRAHRATPASPPAQSACAGGGLGERLAAAAALLELGAPNGAWEVLDQLDAGQQASPEVLALRAKVFLVLEMPGMADLVTFAIQAGSPGWAHRHLLAAQALARLGLTDRAKELAQIARAIQPKLKFDARASEDLASLLHADSP